MKDLRQDLRYAARTLRRNPVFTAVAVATLALGIGANAAIFNLLDQVLLRVLPVAHPEQLVLLNDPGPQSGHVEIVNETVGAFSHPMYEDLRSRNQVLSGVLARFPADVNLGRNGDTERAKADLVSGDYFDVLGLHPALGRLFTLADDRTPGAHPVLVLSYGYWKRRFGADPGILGQALALNGHPMTVVGVSPPGFRGIEAGRPVDVMVPMMMKGVVTPTWDWLEDRRGIWLQIMGRLAPGVSRSKAEASLNVLYHQILVSEVGQMEGTSEGFRKRFLSKHLELIPGGQGIPDLEARLSAPLALLMTMVGLVLLIACANVANLLLARASSRQKEIAVRLALGASRGRLVRQLLVESLSLAAAGGATGLLVASWTGSFLVRILPDQSAAAQALSAQVNLPVVAFTLALAVLTGIVFGLVPALQATRPALAPTLKDASGTVSGAAGPMRFRKGLVVAQVALSMLLLVGAGLFARSLHNLRSLDTGFERERLISFSVQPALNGYDPARKLALYRRIRDRLRALPGVQAVSLAQEPLMTQSIWRSTISVEGYEPREGEDMAPQLNALGPSFFHTLGTPVLAGREFQDGDTADAPRVAIVNQTFARYFFGSESPVGRHLGVGRDRRKLGIEIVGLVQDGLIDSLRGQVPRMAYLPETQAPDSPGVTFYLRSATEPGILAASLRESIRQVDPNLPVFAMTTMDAQIDDSLFVDRMVALLSAAFGGLATLLAAVGLFGVMSYAVSRRTREIGVRVALGAERRRILGLVLREVAVLSGLGMLLGLPGGWGVGRLVESQLYGLHAVDPLTLLLATVTLAAAALLAGFVPAFRATRVDPVVALRYE